MVQDHIDVLQKRANRHDLSAQMRSTVYSILFTSRRFIFLSFLLRSTFLHLTCYNNCRQLTTRIVTDWRADKRDGRIM